MGVKRKGVKRRRALGLLRPDFGSEVDPLKRQEISVKWVAEWVQKCVDAYDPGTWNDAARNRKGIHKRLPGKVKDQILEGRNAKWKAWKRKQKEVEVELVGQKVEDVLPSLTRKERWDLETLESSLAKDDPLRAVDAREKERVAMYPDTIPISGTSLRKCFDLLVEGRTVSSALKEIGYTRQKFHLALARHPEAKREYDAICLIRADIMADEVVEIADHAEPTQTGISHATLKINARKWTAGMLNPRKFSEKLQVEQTVEHKNRDLSNVPTEVLEKMLNEITKYKTGAIDGKFQTLEPGESQILPVASRGK
jgi:hypothetical protein